MVMRMKRIVRHYNLLVKHIHRSVLLASLELLFVVRLCSFTEKRNRARIMVDGSKKASKLPRYSKRSVGLFLMEVRPSQGSRPSGCVSHSSPYLSTLVHVDMSFCICLRQCIERKGRPFCLLSLLILTENFQGKDE